MHEENFDRVWREDVNMDAVPNAMYISFMKTLGHVLNGECGQAFFVKSHV